MSVDEAIDALLQLVPTAEIGKTAQPGSKDFERARNLTFRRCDCGHRRAGWRQPEFIAELADRGYLYVGYDARSNKISCGTKGYHSAQYADDAVCPTSAH